MQSYCCFFDVLFAVRVVGSQTSKDVFKRRRSTGSLELNFCPTFWTNRLYNEKEAKKYKFGTVRPSSDVVLLPCRTKFRD